MKFFKDFFISVISNGFPQLVPKCFVFFPVIAGFLFILFLVGGEPFFSAVGSSLVGAFMFWLAVASLYSVLLSLQTKGHPLWKVVGVTAASYFAVIVAFCQCYISLATNTKDAFTDSSPFTIFEATYFSVVTMATVGYGDISPKSPMTKLFVCMQIVVGVFYNITIFSIFSANIVSRRSSLFGGQDDA